MFYLCNLTYFPNFMKNMLLDIFSDLFGLLFANFSNFLNIFIPIFADFCSWSFSEVDRGV